MAFLAWFGGIGYILATRSRFIGVIVLAFAIAGGLTASWMVFKFMVKLMNAESSHLKDEDYRHEGLVCTVTMPVRENGTGEIIYMQNGVRRSAGARSCNGAAAGERRGSGHRALRGRCGVRASLGRIHQLSQQ